MSFLDKSGLARLWANILVLADTKVPITRKVNGKSLSTDITISANDIGAASTDHTHEIADIDNLQTVLDGKANTSHNHNDIYYTKTEMDDIELVTISDIDTICGTSIQVATASEVTF